MTRVGLGDGDTPMAIKARAMLVGTGWRAYTGVLDQLSAVALVLAVGMVTSWCFGREFTDRTFPSLFALPVGRVAIAAAKLVVLGVWGFALVLVTVAVAAPLGPAAGVGAPGAPAIDGVVQVLVTGLFSAGLGITFAWPASAGRGYLTGISALIGVIVVTQIVSLTGAGPWFPYAVPGLRVGMGGAAVAAAVPPLALLIPALTVLACCVLTLRWWDRARVA